MLCNDIILTKIKTIFRSNVKKRKKERYLVSWFPSTEPRVDDVLV